MKKTFFLLFFFIVQFAFGQSNFFNYNDAHFFVGQKKIVQKVFWDFDNHLTEKSEVGLDSIYEFMKNHDSISLEIGCHTDFRGTDEYNNKISQNHAERVLSYLVAKGIDKYRLIAKGYGETQPLFSNQNPDGTDNYENMSKNRRTELKIISTHK
jgi:outer membrane protein OmpA-like peptidoglycan-associated protein